MFTRNNQIFHVVIFLHYLFLITDGVNLQIFYLSIVYCELLLFLKMARKLLPLNHY